MKSYHFILVAFLLNIGPMCCQNFFNVTIPSHQNNVDAIYHPLIELYPDTLIAFTNTIYSNRYGGECSFIKLSSYGQVFKIDKFLDTTNEVIISDAKMFDHNVYLSGSKFIHIDTSEISWFAKLDSSLDTLWTKEFETAYNSPAFYNIYKLKNSNLVLCGNDALVRPSGSLISSNGVLYLADSLGNRISYIEIIDSINFPIFYNITEDNTGNIYACGILKKNDLNHDVLIIKANPEGKLLWRKQISSPDYSEGLNYCSTLSDGNILFVGVSYKPNFFDDDFSYVLLINLFPDGKINFTKRIIQGFENYNSNCVTDIHGDVICAGYYKPERNTKSDGWICKFTPNGDSIWSRSINNSDLSTEQFFNIANALDGGYYLTGFSFIKGINTSKSWIVKVDSFGCLVPGCQNVIKTKDVDEGKVKAFEFYPNPAKEVLYFLSRVTKNDEYLIRVNDLQGKEVYNYNFIPDQGKQYIMEFTNEMLPGIYVLRILDGKGKIIQTESIEKL